MNMCEWLRNKRGLDLPVLMLTARDTLNDKLKGFNSGTDDYLVKAILTLMSWWFESKL